MSINFEYSTTLLGVRYNNGERLNTYTIPKKQKFESLCSKIIKFCKVHDKDNLTNKKGTGTRKRALENSEEVA